jgi:hypothetical protein
MKYIIDAQFNHTLKLVFTEPLILVMLGKLTVIFPRSKVNRGFTEFPSIFCYSNFTSGETAEFAFQFCLAA